MNQGYFMLAFRMQSGWLMMRTGNQAQSWQGLGRDG